MTQITVSQDKLNKVLTDVEVLIEDVSSLINQNTIAEKRLSDIKQNPSIAMKEEEIDSYIKKRGVKID